MPITGDIKALYAYHRLSDHVSTSLTLKNKVLTEEVWFEGHMDMSFKNCQFNASFYFGVEGERLAEDTRDEDFFPPYGSNGVSFDGSTLSEYFEIAENCVVVFVNCTLEKSFKVSKNCRVEFIDCILVEGAEFEDFCDVRFRRCEFPSFDFKIKGKTGCKFNLDDCDYTSYSTYFMHLDDDCNASIVNSDTPKTIDSSQEIFSINNNSVLDIYNFSSLTSTTTAIYSNKSKVKGRLLTLIDGDISAIKAEDSEVYLATIGTISSADTAIDLTNTLLRMKTNTLIEGVAKAIKGVNSTVNITSFGSIKSTTGNCIEGTETNFNINNGELIEASGEGAYGIYSSGISKSTLSSITTAIKGTTGGVYAGDNAEVCVTLTSEIRGESTNGVHIVGGLVVLTDVDTVYGLSRGILSESGGALRVNRVTTAIYGESDQGIYLVNSTYELQNIAEIYSSSSNAVYVINGQGILRAITKLRADQATVIEGTLSTLSSFIATEITEITSEQGGLVLITGDNSKDSFVKLQNIASMTTTSAPEDAIKIDGIHRIELDNIAEINVETAGRYVVLLGGVSPGYGVIKVLDCKSIESQSCRGGLLVQNALLSDVVGVNDTCAISIGTGITFAFGAVNTNLLLQNFSEIKVDGGDARGFYAYTRSLPGCDMVVRNIGTIKSKEAGAVGLDNLGTIKFIDVARIETEAEVSAFYGEGQGTYVLQGGHYVTTIATGAEDSSAIEIKGAVGAGSANVEMQQVLVEKGKTTLNTVVARIRGCTLRDFSALASRVKIYSTEFNTQELFETVDSALYFFDTTLNGEAKGACTNSTLTFEDSTLNTTGDSFTGMNSSSILGNNSIFNCESITGFKAAQFNACSGDSEFDCQGVIMNGCNFTGEIISSGYSARAGLLINGSYLAEITATQNAAVFLNGTHSLENLTVGDNNAIYANYGYFSKDTTIGDGNALVSNYGVLRNISGGRGNILYANRTTVNAVQFEESNAVIFNYCTPTSEGISIGEDSYLELNAIVAPYMPVTLADHCAFVGNTLRISSLIIPATSAALTTNMTTSETNIDGDLICSGGVLAAYSGAGRMIATQRVPLSLTCEPQDVSAGILVRGEDVGAQVLLWSEKTALQMGDNNARSDAKMYALQGAARVVGPLAILQGIATGDAYCQVQGKEAQRSAPQGGVLDSASGDIKRQASSNVIDIAGIQASREANIVKDDAAEEAIRNAKNILDEAEVDATRKAGETLSDEAGGDAFRTATGSIIDIADQDASRAAPNGTISDSAGAISHDPPV